MKQIESTKHALIKAFDRSKSKTIVDVCRVAGVTRGTFYFHFYKDAEFRKAFYAKQQERFAEKAATV